MKTFEERYTAWLDGAMDERERAEFEEGLPDREAAVNDATAWKKLSGHLRETLRSAAMPHADFVNSQVIAEIERDIPNPRAPARSNFPVGRLAWSGALLLMLAGTISALILPWIGKAPTEDQFISQVVAAHAADPKLSAYAFAAPGGKGAVLWVQDAGYIPANEKIK